MATYEQYIAQGKTPDQIMAATKTAYGENSQQYQNVLAKSTAATKQQAPAPAPTPVVTQDNLRGGVSQENYDVMNAQHKQNLASGMTNEQSSANIKGTLQNAGVYDKVKAQYEGTPSVAPSPAAPVAPSSPAPVAPAKAPAPTQSETERVNANLAEGQKNDQGIQAALASGDQKTFKQRYDYDTASEEKKKALDAFWKSNSPSTPDEFFFASANGMDVSKSEDPQAAVGKHRYDQAKSALGMSADDLKSQMVGGSLVEGSEKWNDIIKLNGGQETPAMVQAKAEAKKIRDAANIARDSKIAAGEKVDDKNTTQEVSDKLLIENGPDYVKMLQDSITGNKEINDLASQVTSADKSIKDLEDAKKATMDDILRDHPGLPTSLLYSLVESRNAPIDRELDGKRAERDRLASNLKYKTEQATALYEAKVKQAESRVDYLRKQAQIQAEQAFQTKMKQEDWSHEDKKTREDHEWQMQQFNLQQAYKNPDINSKDPVIASIAAKSIIDSEEEFAKKYGIPTTGKDYLSIAKKYAADKGIPLSDALYATFIEPRHNSAEYKAVVKAMNENATEDKNKPMVVSSGSVIYDPSTKSFISPPSSTGSSLNASLLGNKWYNMGVGENAGVECARYAVNAVGMSDIPGGDDLSKRLAAFNEQEGKVGGLVLFNGGGYDKTYGHMAVVKSVNADGTITVKESNYHGDKKITERTIPTTYVAGYYNNTPLANSVGTTSVLPKDAIEQIASYKADINKYLARATPAQRGEILKAVSQVNPAYDEKLMSSAKKETENWTSSKANTTGGNIVALNQAIHHMKTLEGVSNAINNGQVKAANSLLNSIGYNTGGAEVSNFGTAAQAVATEVGKVFRGAGSMSLQEIEDWKKNINPNMSKEQYEGFLRTTSDLLKGRLSSLESSWHGSFGKNVPTPKPVIDDESKAILDSFYTKGAKDTRSSELQKKYFPTK